MQRFIIIGIATAAFSVVSVHTTGAQAGSFGLREQSAIGQGQNEAGVAAGTAGVASMFWNPATITEAAGSQIQVNASALFPYANVTPLAGTSPMFLGSGSGSTGDVLPNVVLPSAFLSHQINERWWFGLGVDSPYGSQVDEPRNYFGQIYARTTSVRSYEATPTVAFKATDWLSLGFGARATYFKVKLGQALSPVPGSQSGTFNGDSWGAGFTAGATLTPRAGTEIGVGYRSQVYESLDGSLAIDGQGSVPAKTSLHLPDQVTVGLRQAVNQDLTLSAGYEWTQWSRLGTVAIQSALGSSPLPFNYKDGNMVSAGGEYRFNPNIMLRAGLGYEWSPISVTNRNMRSPDSDRVSVSAGLGIRVSDAVSVDVAYSHYFFVGDKRVEVEPGSPLYVGLPLVAEFASDADVGSVGLTYRW